MLVHVHVGGLHMTLFLAVYFYSLVVHVTCYMYIAQITLNQLAAFTVILAKLKHVYVHMQYIILYFHLHNHVGINIHFPGTLINRFQG